MIKANIYTQKGEVKGTVDLPVEMFELPWNNDLVHQVVVSLGSNLRNGNAHTKQRGEVRGGGRKPWKQKGTGRARHGSNRSPLWVGGGITFGPRNERNYNKSINKKMRRKALFTVLSKKAKDDGISFIDSFNFEKPSTKEAKLFVEKICGDDITRKNVCTVVFSETNDNLRKSLSNLPGVKTIDIDGLTALSAITARRIIFLNEEATIENLNKKNV